jgi:hypothetical protein
MRSDLIQNSYVYLPRFIDPKEAASYADEFSNYCQELNVCGDDQVPNSSAVYDFLPFVRLLIQKVPHVTELLGEQVLPTYTYARVYKKGAVLHRHRDRNACEISLTVNLAKDADWPIYFNRPDGSEAHVELEAGDAVMYLGCEADHWRNALSGMEHTQLFMHYVKSYGINSWTYFDKSK